MQIRGKNLVENYEIAAKQHYPCVVSAEGRLSVFATQKELALLHRCAAWLREDAQRRIQIFMFEEQNLKRFIAKTLMHFGASCSQIEVDKQTSRAPADGVWLILLQVANAR